MVTVAKLPKGHLDLTRKVLLELKQVFRLDDTDILKNRLYYVLSRLSFPR